MKITSFARTCSVAAVLSLSACATVDVTAIGGVNANVETAEVVETGNVITRTVKRLYQVFTARGWYEDTSRQRVQSATNVLLNGLKDIDVDAESNVEVTYASEDVLLDEVKTARYHLRQTIKAAEVYLDIASSDAELTDELKQLQKAVHVTEQAHENFSNQESASKLVASELNGFALEVESLRTITNNFGDIVRARRLAIKSASAS